MKSLTQFIQEKLIIKKNKSIDYKYFPQTKEELKEIIEKRIKEEGNERDLNDIDVSKITDMSELFWGTNFNGDISSWDVSNVTSMESMFSKCKNFNKNISKWDVSNVTNMFEMFEESKFNGDISDWDVSNCRKMNFMFDNSPLEKNPPKWYKKIVI